MQINLSQNRLDALIESLGDLTWRYEIEAASFAVLGGLGRELAEQRIANAREVHALRDFFSGTIKNRPVRYGNTGQGRNLNHNEKAHTCILTGFEPECKEEIMRELQQSLMTVREAAVFLDLNRSDLYRLKDKPEGLRAYRIGRLLRFKPEEVAAYKLRMKGQGEASCR